MSGPFIVFDLLIPRTDDRTGVVHPPSLFDEWTIETAERFGGVSLLAADILTSGEAELIWADRE